eukprot:13308483-Alexandrium_andersonii.AAC.1
MCTAGGERRAKAPVGPHTLRDGAPGWGKGADRLADAAGGPALAAMRLREKDVAERGGGHKQ